MSGYAAVFTLLAEMRASFGFSETAIGNRWVRFGGFSRSCCYLGALTLAKAG